MIAKIQTAKNIYRNNTTKQVQEILWSVNVSLRNVFCVWFFFFVAIPDAYAFHGELIKRNVQASLGSTLLKRFFCCFFLTVWGLRNRRKNPKQTEVVSSVPPPAAAAVWRAARGPSTATGGTINGKYYRPSIFGRQHALPWQNPAASRQTCALATAAPLWCTSEASSWGSEILSASPPEPSWSRRPHCGETPESLSPSRASKDSGGNQ